MQQAVSLVKLLRKHTPGLAVHPLGGGTNLVGSDVPLKDTVFIKLASGDEFTHHELRGDGTIRAGAGLSLKNVIDFACACGMGGASAVYGIPGTVGGAVCMNAGANGKCTSDFIRSVAVLNLDNGDVIRARKKGFCWSYRKSSIASNQMVLEVDFEFETANPEEETKLLQKEVLRRMRAPAGRSAGSIFKNPSPELPAGRILEKCGAKQLNTGRFQVSADHANWIINRTDRAEMENSEKAFLAVADAMAQRVYEQCSIVLQPEVRFMNPETAEKFGKERKPVKVLVLKGGTSSERDVSLQSGTNVAEALRNGGFQVTEYDIQKLEITQEMREADVVYPVLHGGFGEDGRLKKLLEDAGIPAVGIPAVAMKQVMDKIESKEIMLANGITTPRYAKITDKNAPVPAGMELPLIVKPCSEGSTFGLTLVEDAADWQKALETALEYDTVALAEEFIQGIEGTVGILLGKALPVIEIRYPGKIYDYDAKYTHAQGETVYNCPPHEMTEQAQKRAQELALKFAQALNADQLMRVDVMVRESDGEVFVLEGNAMPGCTASSLLPKAAIASGVSLVELHARLVQSAYSAER